MVWAWYLWTPAPVQHSQTPKISRPKPASVPQIHRIMSETAESIIIFHWLKTHHQFWLTLSDFSNKRLNPTGNPLLCFQSTPPLKVFEGQEYLYIIVLCSFMANEHNLITICAEVYYRYYYKLYFENICMCTLQRAQIYKEMYHHPTCFSGRSERTWYGVAQLNVDCDLCGS